jgi:hypothetical protein
MSFATTIPATRAAPTTSNGFSPSPFSFGGGAGNGVVRPTLPAGIPVGASPFARATIKLGFSFRRKSASSARGSANIALIPPSAAARSANSRRRSAARSMS